MTRAQRSALGNPLLCALLAGAMTIAGACNRGVTNPKLPAGATGDAGTQTRSGSAASAVGTGQQVTITFAGLSGDGSPVATYTESGFTVSAVARSWQALTTYGHPAPSLVFVRPATDPTITAEARISAGGRRFSFTSVDLYSSVTPIPYAFTGVMGSTTAFTVSGTVPNTSGNFATVANPNSTIVVDALLIRLSNPATPCCSNPVGFDNVVLVF